MLIRIQQWNKTITFFSAGNARQITERLTAKAEEVARKMKDAGKMEGGYFSCELVNNLEDRESVTSCILIA